MAAYDPAVNLKEYCQELNQLDSENICTPNQSLILDYFCRDQEFTDFLRSEVFAESSSRNKTWCAVNLKCGVDEERLTQEDLYRLLENKDTLIAKLWGDIVMHTAKHQSHEYVSDYIRNLNERPSANADSRGSQAHDQLNTGNQEERKLVHLSSARNSSYLSNVRLNQSAERVNKSNQSNRPVSLRSNNQDIVAPLVFGSLAIIMTTSLAILAGGYNTKQSNRTTKLFDNNDSLSALASLESKQNQAVLICEHNPIIQAANNLTLNDPKNKERRNNLVARSKKAIAFLDQNSAKGYEYAEYDSCTWGGQWFDNNSDKGFRYYLATSIKCLNPTVHYRYTRGKDENATLANGQYNATGHRTGEITLPYADVEFEHSIWIDKVTCT
jgi:hypothetical protein